MAITLLLRMDWAVLPISNTIINNIITIVPPVMAVVRRPGLTGEYLTPENVLYFHK